MLLTDARRPAHTDAAGALVPMADQGRGRWDAAAVVEGTALVTAAMRRGDPGPYQLQAAIAAVHAEAGTAADTDWPQILALYTLLERRSGNPVVTLNRTVAAAMVHRPAAGLRLLDTVAGDDRPARNHRVDAVGVHLCEMAGEEATAARWFRAAAKRATNPAEQRHLMGRAARLGG